MNPEPAPMSEQDKFEEWYHSPACRPSLYLIGKEWATAAWLASAASREAEHQKEIERLDEIHRRVCLELETKMQALRAKLAGAHKDNETIHKIRNGACAELELRNILLMQLEAKLAGAEKALVIYAAERNGGMASEALAELRKEPK